MNDVLEMAAEKYSLALATADSLGVDAEPEAQLTVPTSELFRALADSSGIGDLVLIREAQLDGVRPDFAALVDRRPCGWVELKAPGHTLIGDKWRGREALQWKLLAQLDSLIVTNGASAVLYREGAELATATLPVHGASGWDPKPITSMLQLFASARPSTITRVSQLAHKLAPLAALLRGRLEQGAESNAPGFADAIEAWRVTVQRNATAASFATDVAQVVSYSMAIAALNGNADRNEDGLITIDEARVELRLGPNNVLAAALGPVLGVPEMMQYARPEIGAIERLVSAIDPERISQTFDSRGEPWLWFYEDFLAVYDPEARSQAGVYYTPTPVVSLQTRLVDDILRNPLERNLGFGAPSVVTLDPATGSGTYPLAIIDHAIVVAKEERGPAGAIQVAENLSRNLAAFEILPGPYAVAHLRIGQRLAEVSGHWHQLSPVRVYLTDTLEGPDETTQKGLFGDARILAEEAAKARHIKHEGAVTVVIGNPPYDRVESGNGGGWILHPDNGRALFRDVIEPAQRDGVIFSAQASLYNQYVYFWRWAIWKAFEENPKQAAVVSFITASSWLRGPAFSGLRKLASDHADEIWVVDLGGEGRGARVEDNVFAIQSPVAIVTMFRRPDSKTRRGAAKVHYRRVQGASNEKLSSLADISSPRETPEEWRLLVREASGPLAPPSGDQQWTQHPLLTDIFPWQQPGMMAGRAWGVSPSRETLVRRWRELLADPQGEARAERYSTPKTGRNIYTKVAGLPSIATLKPTDPPEPIVRTAWRSFDRQWILRDPRLISLERPALWSTVSNSQLFMVGMLTNPMGSGPGLTVATEVPDKHYFANRGGKDVIPLYRDSSTVSPNVTDGLLAMLTAAYGAAVSPEDLAGYVYALLAHSGYTAMFHKPLQDPGPRVPMTKNPEVFRKVSRLGQHLLWLQTYGERFANESRPKNRVPRTPGVGWRLPVTAIPSDSKDFGYNKEREEIHVGDGVVTGVSNDVWEFSVSGMNILDKWLGARTRKGIGKAASKKATPLDKIRPTVWNDAWNDELLDLVRVLSSSLELAHQQQALLEEVLESELFTSEELPKPTIANRSIPNRSESPTLL